MRRRRLTIGAASALVLLLLARNPPRELAERVRFLVAYAPRSIAVRRLGGSSTAFDRGFFVFLESARRKMPRGVAGVAVLVPDPSEAQLYLAAYEFAPIPASLAPSQIPAGWIAALYGTQRPPGWRVLAEVTGGALLAPGPASP